MGPMLTWRAATEAALYGPDGFYRRSVGPAGHFRTSVHASSLFAQALLRVAADVDTALGHPDPFDVVDVGAGRGELLTALSDHAPAGLRERLRLHGVEVAARPADLPTRIGWDDRLPEDVSGLVVANEWLDDVPVDVALRADGQVRVLLVDPATGEESPGPPLDEQELAWLDQWWPLADSSDGARAEIGRPRDKAWSRAIGVLRGGVAVAVDYGHRRHERMTGRYASGTLLGYREGRAVLPVPDGTCDITSHVAMDAVASAGERAGATATLLTTQRQALRALGVSGSRPSTETAHTDPTGYLAALASAGEAAELTDPAGLGGFLWLVQAVGVDLPAALAGAATVAEQAGQMAE